MKFNQIDAYFTVFLRRKLYQSMTMVVIFLLVGSLNVWCESPPNVIQLLVVQEGQIIALTEDKAGLFFSNDGGRKWYQAKGLDDLSLYHVSTDYSGTLFLSTASGVFISTNGGADWFQDKKTNNAFIVFTPDASSCLIKKWGEGLFYAPVSYFKNREEVPAGKADVPLQPVLGLPEPTIQSVIFTRDNGAFAGLFGKGVFHSLDGGLTWSSANQGLENTDILTLSFHPGTGLFAGTYGGGLFKWSKAASNWSRVAIKMQNCTITCLALGSNGKIVAGTREGGIHLSKDGGTTWTTPFNTPLSGANIQAIALSGNSLWASAYGKGLFVSRDDGTTWAPRPFAYVSKISQLTTTPKAHWYAAVTGLGLLQSRDHGTNWKTVPLPFPQEEHIYLASRKNDIWLASPKSGPFVSRDGEGRWQKKIQGLPEEGIDALRVSPDESVFVTSMDGKGLFRLDFMDTWKKISVDDGYEYSAWDLLFLPNGEAVVWGYNDVLFSRHGLKQWHRERIPQAFKALWIDQQTTVWTRRMISTFAFSNDGLNFLDKEKDPPRDQYTFFAQLNPHQFAATASSGGIHILQREGKTLTPIVRCLENKKVLSMAVDASFLLIGTDTGLFVSQDQGSSWQQIELFP